MYEQLPGVQPAPAALSVDDPYEIGGYRLHARLGSGGMGVVYLAYTPGGRPVALKAVRREFAADPEFRERFAQEVASARRIHGLFTAQVVDSGADDPTPWLATAYVPGPSLHEVVRRYGPLPVRTVLLLVAGIAEALQEIHRVGVVHRDLKPANVLIAGDGPRVIDFGIARAADAAALTGTGLRIGTAAFMAPEQALGLQVTPATDVFALGTLAGYVAGGAPPFGNGPESSVLYRVVHEHADLSHIPRDLHELVSWCLAKRAGDRPSTGELIEYVHAHPVVGPRPEFTEGWLPRPVGDEVGGREDGGGPAPAPAHLQETRSATAPARPAVIAPAAPTPPGAAAPAPAPAVRAPGPARGRLPIVALAVAGTLLACAGAAYYLDDPGGSEGGATGGTHDGPNDGANGGADQAASPPARPRTTPSPSPSASPAPGYLPGYARVRLTAPDPGYEFDLKAGKVVATETATWYLARDGQAFLPSEESDAFVPDAGEPTAADCVRGIETRPAAALPFSALTKARPFCVRSPDRGEIAIVRLVEAAAGGSVTIVVDQYRRA
ncbi:serine/threonine protein kinase [Streptomyces sp. NBC_00536]|uniref:serine/threonine-protein kinase n=1 Tax=Streptomyces sp. NBC_00536 TaxID=2975769 RepID=UPI002E813482|nr:serine/threonine-protein kinase [Streptomyces sp. NBC_00536]WUC83003.1 serine/threonine protein kinase [Streptomyces sp. NBC_00536]